jgi:hypothetical protein
MSDLNTQEPQTIGELELCLLLGKSTRALSYWRHEKMAPRFHREGKSIRYYMSDVEDFLQNHDKRIKLASDEGRK